MQMNAFRSLSVLAFTAVKGSLMVLVLVTSVRHGRIRRGKLDSIAIAD